MKSEHKRWGKLLFLAYGIWMLWLLYGQRLGFVHPEHFGEYLAENVNLKPFYTIRNYWYVAFRTGDRDLLQHIVINLAGNVVMFIPLGFFLPFVWEKFRKMWKLVLVCTGIIVCIELVQMVTMLGSLDVDDLILNLLGCMIGYGIWKLWNR